MKRNKYAQKRLHANPKVNKFMVKHAPFVMLGTNRAIFHDAAIMEVTCTGPGNLIPPPEDRLARANLIHLYCKEVANRAVTEFEDYKEQLEGMGEASDEEEALDDLKRLRDKARKATAKLREAKKEVEANTPAWITAKKRMEASNERLKKKFRGQVLEIKL